ncbi:hypothetical protein HGA64_04870, partial [Candidatus Falkowbacteria bacterium]|nr:hypothetical protein [Candidatus Falkowbacteria bacterium]
GRVVEVGINHVVDVYNDYVKWEISEDGWDLAGAFGIIENWLYSFQTPALISYLLEFIGVKVLKGYEPKFSKAFFRLLLLDTLHMLLEEGGIGCEFIVTPDELLDSDFTSKFWNYIRFYDPREREIASKTENVNDWLTNIILKDREMNQIFSGK